MKNFVVKLMGGIVIFLLTVHILYSIPALNNFFEAKWEAGDFINFVAVIFVAIVAFGQNLQIKQHQEKLNSEILIEIMHESSLAIKNNTGRKYRFNEAKGCLEWYKKDTKLVQLRALIKIKILNDVIPDRIDINNLMISGDYNSQSISKTNLIKGNIVGIEPNILKASNNILEIALIITDDDFKEILSIDDPQNIQLVFDLKLEKKLGIRIIQQNIYVI